MTAKNKEEWIKKASELSQRQLEREIVRVRPQQATLERASYVTPERVKLELGLSEREMLKLRRVQDLLSQARRRSVSLEEAVGALTAEFLHRNDPLEKAKRHQVRRGGAGQASPPADRRSSQDSGGRVRELVSIRVERQTLSARTTHAVNLRDGRGCTHISAVGQRCNQTRWLEIHHKTPVSEGGSNHLENLTTLCSAHHRYLHLNGDSRNPSGPAEIPAGPEDPVLGIEKSTPM